MRHILLLITFTLFGVAYACDYVIAARHDTAALELQHYRETFTVNEGLAPEGGLLIEKVKSPGRVPHHLTIPNDTRNLRLFISGERPDATLYLESLNPHQFYRLSLPFSVTPGATGFRWIGPTVFILSTPNDAGINAQYVLDVRTISIRPLESLSNLRLIIPGMPREIDSHL